MFRLFYNGKGCGGVNLPFATVEAAQAYAPLQYATDYRIESASGDVVILGFRSDRRSKFTRTGGAKTCSTTTSWRNDMIAHFNTFSITLPRDAVADMSAPGARDESVAFWSRRVPRPKEATVLAVKRELREYGAWDDDELDDDAANWQRILWLAACEAREENGGKV